VVKKETEVVKLGSLCVFREKGGFPGLGGKGRKGGRGRGLSMEAKKRGGGGCWPKQVIHCTASEADCGEERMRKTKPVGR